MLKPFYKSAYWSGQMITRKAEKKMLLMILVINHHSLLLGLRIPA